MASIRFFLPLVFLTLISGCSGMEKLKTENASLKTKISELEQVKKDYSDKLQTTQQQSAQEQARLREELEQLRTELNEKLQQQISENQALVQKIEDLTVISIGEEALFGSGIADLTRDGAETIAQMSEALANYPDYHIRVEGHTDDRPIGKNIKTKFFSNWELSTARATSVVRYMIYALHFDPQRLSAAGFAQYRPVADNSDKQGRAANRRIRVVVFRLLQ